MKPIKKLNGKTIAIVGLGKSWFEFAKNNEVIEPNAMVLSTLNNNSINSRTVLLKDISSESTLYELCEEKPELIINLDLNKLEKFISNNL